MSFNYVALKIFAGKVKNYEKYFLPLRNMLTKYSSACCVKTILLTFKLFVNKIQIW